MDSTRDNQQPSDNQPDLTGRVADFARPDGLAPLRSEALAPAGEGVVSLNKVLRRTSPETPGV